MANPFCHCYGADLFGLEDETSCTSCCGSSCEPEENDCKAAEHCECKEIYILNEKNHFKIFREEGVAMCTLSSTSFDFSSQFFTQTSFAKGFAWRPPPKYSPALYLFHCSFRT